MRPDGRAHDELRPFGFERDFTAYAHGSVLVTFGDTKVLCTAMLDEDVPRWMRNSGKGWVTAEYSMLPGLVARADPPRDQGPEGSHPGDPAADRSGAALGGRHEGARRAPDPDRLRRAAGRRRHPHRVDHRRLPGAARLPDPDGAGGAARRGAAARRAGGDLGRRRRTARPAWTCPTSRTRPRRPT